MNDNVSGIRESPLSRITAISMKSIGENTDPVKIAFDYTHEDFYGDRDLVWIHAWTGDHGIKGIFSYLTAGLVNRDLRFPLISIPSPKGNDMPSVISLLLTSLKRLLSHVDLLMFDRGFYSKELMMELNKLEMNYLIFVPKNTKAKEEFSGMCQTEKKIGIHELSLYQRGKRISDSVHLAFLKQTFDHRTEEY